MKKLANVSSKQFIMIREVDDAEHSFILPHLENLSQFEKHIDRLNDVYLELEEINNSVTHSNKQTELLKHLKTFFFSFKTFHDHWETLLKRTFTVNSPQWLNFKSQKSYEYDNTFAYRFIYHLRNYVQHCGMPHIQLKANLNERDEPEYRLLLNVEQLLETYDWKPIIINDFKLLEGDLDLLHLLNNIKQPLANIQIKAINCLNILSVLESAKAVLEYRKFKQDGFELAIFEYLEMHVSGSPKNTSMIIFPFGLAEHVIKNITGV
ncbi:MAG: hypothetical protein H7Y13_03885 [Sphingobacteriaceae bacterium]|nr:hypothetical protein [Sphingobacteriaceae bacterium]